MENNINEGAAPRKKLGTGAVTAITAAACIVAALCVFLMIWYLGDSYPDFERRFSKEVAIPGLDDGFMPQGIENYDGVTYVSGYMADGSPSRIYAVGEDGEQLGYITVKGKDGPYSGHACGIATNGKKMWMVSEGTVYVLKYSDVKSNMSPDGGEAEVSGTWNAHCGADFCHYDGTYFYVGEFYRKGNYETDKAHRFETPAGDKNTAVILRYSSTTAYESENYDQSNLAPSRAYSIPGEIQGMAFNEKGDKIILSQSYALKNSHILVYEFDQSDTAYESSILKINGKSVRTYFLDSANLTSDYEIPCMSEGLYSDGDKVYVLFESAGKIYAPWVRERLYNVYSFRVRR